MSYEAVDAGERRRWVLVGDVAIEVIAGNRAIRTYNISECQIYGHSLM